MFYTSHELGRRVAIVQVPLGLSIQEKVLKYHGVWYGACKWAYSLVAVRYGCAQNAVKKPVDNPLSLLSLLEF